MITTLSTITTWHSQRSLEWYTYLGRFWDFNPQGPQQLRCWKWRLLFSVLHPNTAPGLLVRHCWRYRARARRKWRTAYNRKETITMQGCQSTPVAWPYAVWRHTAWESKPQAKGDWLGLKGIKNWEGGFLSLYRGCVHTLPTHIYVQTPCKSGFCIIGAL